LVCPAGLLVMMRANSLLMAIPSQAQDVSADAAELGGVGNSIPVVSVIQVDYRC
jgi:hypothetical protein